MRPIQLAKLFAASAVALAAVRLGFDFSFLYPIGTVTLGAVSIPRLF